jgi:bifunctional N-acetylglucosamine-1-phosphate-uridyltransferase/glucosamine-1-phosphate-acetyltransferase GlmU-like protein
VRGELICGRDVEIDIGCIFEGRVELGDGVCVGAHSVLRNVTVAAGTRIAPFCHFDDCRASAPTASSAPMRDCARAACWPTTCTSATSSK